MSTQMNAEMREGHAALMSQIKSIALRYLARRDYSRLELSQKIFQRLETSDQESHQEIEIVLDGLEASSLLSDLRFAMSTYRHRVSMGYGQRWIRQYLKQVHGVSNDLLMRAEEEVEIDWDQACEAARERAERQYRGSPEKIKSYLWRRGF